MNIFLIRQSLLDYLYISISFINNIELALEKNIEQLVNYVLPGRGSEYFSPVIVL